MKMLFVYLLVLGFGSSVNSAEPCADGDAGTDVGGAAVGDLSKVAAKISTGCPDGFELVNINSLCSLVFDRKKAKLESGFKYEYEKLLSEAACIKSGDLESEKAKKLQSLWSKHQDKFKCNSTDFDVTDGSILKYSIKTRSFGFVNSAATKWKLNLNFIDKSDNKTILDYLKRQIEINKGSDTETELKEYYEILRKSGAMLREELT